MDAAVYTSVLTIVILLGLACGSTVVDREFSGRKLLIAGAAATFFVGMLGELIISLPFYCLGPSSILTHPYSIGATRAFQWHDITSVRVKCEPAHYAFRSYRGPEEDIVLSLVDGEQIVSDLGEKQVIAIQSALSSSGHTESLPHCYR